MVRCPTCHRRLAPASRCPQDGSLAVPPVGQVATSFEEPSAALSMRAPPSVPGLSISGLLGSGGFGTVWEASASDGTTVAVKVSHAADPTAVARLEHEAEALA